MGIKKKFTDFIVLEDNNVGRKAVMTTGGITSLYSLSFCAGAYCYC